MKIFEMYSHHEGYTKLKTKPIVLADITSAFTDPGINFKKGEARTIKKKVSTTLNTYGWADEVKIKPSKLTVNFIKQKVGLCFQIGNVARTYADLLKIQLLFNRRIIVVAVIVVPIRTASKKLGSNHAQFERLEDELKLFSGIITAPIALIGLE